MHRITRHISQVISNGEGKHRWLAGKPIKGKRAAYMREQRFRHEQYQRLLKAGMAKKVAIAAVMRSIVVLANTLLREGRDWQPKRP